MKLIVLSDLHLMPQAVTTQPPEQSGPSGRDLGNHDRLDAAVARINDAYGDADLVVVAGDIADRGEGPNVYGAAKAALDRLDPPWTATIGNHDRRKDFLETFGAGFADANGFAQSAHLVDGHHVLVLDSFKQSADPEWPHRSAPTGALCATRLAWLDTQLKAAAGAPVIAVLHHNVCPVQIVTDKGKLEDPDPFIDRLVAHGGVRHVLSGHIHMTTTTFHRGLPFTTLAGGFTSTAEDFGRAANKIRREGPAQMAVVLSDAAHTTVHFDNYVDAHPLAMGR